MNKQIGIIGIGNMGEVLLRHFLDSGIAKAENMHISDRKKEKLELLKDELNVNVSLDNKETAGNSDVLILAVRPQDLEDVLFEIKSKVKDQLVISVAAGVKNEFIENILNSHVVRVMPNILYNVGKGISAFSLGKNANKEDEEIVREMFGLCLKFDESRMNSATAVMGSGPAFVKYLVDSLILASEKQGFSREEAEKIVVQLLEGVAEAFKKGTFSDVATKGGMTIEGLKVLEEYKVREALIECLKKTKEKGEEFG